MRRVDVSLQYMIDILAKYSQLQTMCAISTDEFNKNLIEEGNKLKKTKNKLLREKHKMRVEVTTIGKIRGTINTKKNLYRCEEVDKETCFYLFFKLNQGYKNT